MFLLRRKVVRMNHPAPERRPRRRLRLLSTLLAVPLLLPAAASAAQGASFEGMLSFGGYHVGAFIAADGSRAYCLEPGADAPLSAQDTPIKVSELPAYSISVNDAWGWKGQVRTSEASGQQLRQMNWVLAEHGDTADAAKAAAVQIALWEIRREPGNAAWIDGKYDLFRKNGGSSHIEAGKRLAVESKTAAVGPGVTVPNGALELVAGDSDGTGTVSYPAGTVSLTIAGGTFEDGSTEFKISGSERGTVGWEAIPHEPAWSRLNDVRISGKWSLKQKYWPAELILHPATRDTEQRIGSGVKPVIGDNTGVLDGVVATFDSRFAPALATQVPRDIVLREDGVFGDTVTVTAADSPWPTRGNGEYLPLVADGTLYGPFDAPQADSVDPPEGAPVAGSASLAIDQGPGDYSADLPVPGASSGYYYWVWGISEERQSEEVRRSEILEPGARYSDRFGVLTERQLVATELRLKTRLLETTLAPGSRVLEDTVRASAVGGSWLRDDAGQRIPANVRLTFYQSDTVPIRQAAAPDDARELGAVFVELTEPETWVAAPPFEIPADTQGWVTVQACVFNEDQSETALGLISEWCDDFGVPDETAELTVEPVTLSKLAQTGAAAGGMSTTSMSALLIAAGMATAGGLLSGIVVIRKRLDRR